jgi:Ca-activated chloride channel homolog
MFEYPWAFTLLLLVPVILILHLVRRKRKVLNVSSLVLWEQVLREHRRTLSLKRLINNINLMLQILAAVLLTLALANPSALVPPSRAEKNLILVMDVSASMQTDEGRQSRFDIAVSQALGIVEGMRRDDMAMIIEAGSTPRLITPFLSDKSRLEAVIRGLEPTDARGSVEKALVMAVSLSDRQRGDRIILLSDGAFDYPAENRLDQINFEYIRVAETEENVGITRFEFRKLLAGHRYEIMATVENFGTLTVDNQLIIEAEGVEIDRIGFRLAPMEQRTFIVPHEGVVAGRAEARLAEGDAFRVDDSAFTVLSKNRTVEILLVSEGNFFLERLLGVMPNTEVTIVPRYPGREIPEIPDPDEEPVLGDDESTVTPDAAEDENPIDPTNFDVVIFDKGFPPLLQPGNYMLIASMAPEVPITEVDRVPEPIITGWERDHPVLRDINLMDLNIVEASTIEVERDAEPLVYSDRTPLVAAWETESIRLLYFAFDLMHSDLPLRTAFPVLVRNSLDWLYGSGLESSTDQVDAGTDLTIPTGRLLTGLAIRRPDGEVETVPFPSNPYVYDNTDAVGFYTVTGEGIERDYAVNLASGTESYIAPRFTPPGESVAQGASGDTPEADIGAGGAAAAQGDAVRKSLWGLFILVTLGVILLEWYFQVRKW